MHPYILKDKIVGQDKIHLFQDVLVNDSYQYLPCQEGIKVKGKINVKGTLVYDSSREDINKNVDIEMTLPNHSLDSRSDIKVNMNDFKYEIKDNVLYLKFSIIVKGLDENIENLTLEKKVEKTPEIFDQYINSDINLTSRKVEPMKEDFFKNFEESLKKEDVDVISTVDEEKENDILEILCKENDNCKVNKKDKISEALDQKDIEIIDDDSIHKIPLETGPILPQVEMNDDKETNKNEKEENNTEPEEESKQEPLFKDVYVSTYFFHRVKKDETLTSIINQYHISMDDFVSLNKKTDLKENDLVQIKVHEK